MVSWAFENGKLVKSYDEELLLKQSIYNMLTIAVGDFAIYSENFGNQALNYLNNDYDILVAKMEEFIKNALLIDDRIASISDVNCSKTSDEICVDFGVVTQDGDTIYIESEVNI